MTRPVRTVNCPHCAKPVPWGPESPQRPFCSERCRLIDLGAWANEDYRVAVKEASDPDDASAVPPERSPT